MKRQSNEPTCKPNFEVMQAKSNFGKIITNQAFSNDFDDNNYDNDSWLDDLFPGGIHCKDDM